jgi:hypothetical protein
LEVQSAILFQEAADKVQEVIWKLSICQF